MKLLAFLLLVSCAPALADNAVSTVADFTPSAGITVNVTGQPVVQIQDVVTRSAMTRARDEILAGAKKSKGVVLVINSPGGEVFSGLTFINTMRQLQQTGVRFTCLVPGMAMSMAFIILSECNERYAWPDSLLLFHPVKVGLAGALSADNATKIAESLNNLEGPIKDRLVRRMGVDRPWFETNYMAETIHRGETLAARAPGFIQLVDSYKGITVSQLNPPPRTQTFEDLFGEEGQLPELIWAQ